MELWGRLHTILSLLETIDPIWVDCILTDRYDENQSLIIIIISIIITTTIIIIIF